MHVGKIGCFFTLRVVMILFAGSAVTEREAIAWNQFLRRKQKKKKKEKRSIRDRFSMDALFVGYLLIEPEVNRVKLDKEIRNLFTFL